MRLKQSRAVFTSSDRAVCREMKESDMAVAAAETKEVKELVALAEAQGWVITSSTGGKLHWKNPDGVNQAYTATRVGNGRDLKNLKARLMRAGLVLEGKEEVAEPVIDITEAQEAYMKRNAPTYSGSFTHETPDLVAALEKKLPGMENLIAGHLATLYNASLMLLHDHLDVLDNNHQLHDSAQDDKVLGELAKENETLAKQLKKAQDDLSRVGKQYVEAQEASRIQTERANKAEAKLKMFRSALADD